MKKLDALLLAALTLIIGTTAVYAAETAISPAQSDSARHYASYLEGYKLMQAGKLTEAEPKMKEIMEVQPEKPSPERNYAFLLNKMGKHDEAIAVCQHVVEIAPDLLAAWSTMGYAYSRLAKWDEASKAYEKILQTKPADANALLGFADASNRMGKYDDTIRVLEPVLTATVEQSGSWQNLGNAYTSSGKYKEAINCFQQFLTLKPDAPDAVSLRKVIRDLQVDAARAENAPVDNYLPQAVSPLFGQTRWPLDKPITIYIKPGDGVPAYKPEYLPMLKQAIDQWVDASSGSVHIVYVDSPDLANVRCGWSNTFPPGTGEAGEGKIKYRGGKLYQVDITLFTVSPFASLAMTDKLAYNTALHEVGHALGLIGHSTSATDKMYLIIDPSKESILSARDIRTIQLLYQKQ